MIAETLIALLAVAAPPAVPGVGTISVSLPQPDAHAAAEHAPEDTLGRVPGSALRLGWNAERAAALGAFRIASASADVVVREGDTRWFGGSARTTLTFQNGHLAQVRLVASPASPRLADFVPDDLRRRGYRRVAFQPEGANSISEWTGSLHGRLTIAPGSVTAEFSPVLPPAAAARDPEPAPALREPLDFTAEGKDASRDPPRWAFTPPDPVRPRIAVDAGVFGRVMVTVEADTAGRVVDARIARGIAELNSAAIDWASRVRFEPYVLDGRPIGFRITIPVAFLPARAPAAGAR